MCDNVPVYIRCEHERHRVDNMRVVTFFCVIRKTIEFG